MILLKPYAALLLVLIQLLYQRSVMAQTNYTIHIDIAATKAEAWDALIDFEAYPSWNSILTMTGNNQLEIGKKFHVTIHDGDKASRFKAVTLSREEFWSFSAKQTIIGKWFFSATHHFILKEADASTKDIRFIQQWHLTGIISKVFKKQIFKQLGLFKQMNLELKTYLENG